MFQPIIDWVQWIINHEWASWLALYYIVFMFFFLLGLLMSYRIKFGLVLASPFLFGISLWNIVASHEYRWIGGAMLILIMFVWSLYFTPQIKSDKQ